MLLIVLKQIVYDCVKQKLLATRTPTLETIPFGQGLILLTALETRVLLPTVPLLPLHVIAEMELEYFARVMESQVH